MPDPDEVREAASRPGYAAAAYPPQEPDWENTPPVDPWAGHDTLWQADPGTPPMPPTLIGPAFVSYPPSVFGTPSRTPLPPVAPPPVALPPLATPSTLPSAPAPSWRSRLFTRPSSTGVPSPHGPSSSGASASGRMRVQHRAVQHWRVRHRAVQHRLTATERNEPRAVRILDAPALSHRRRGVRSTVGVGTPSLDTRAPGLDTRAPGPGTRAPGPCAEAAQTDPRRTQSTQVRYVACAVEPATGSPPREPATGSPVAGSPPPGAAAGQSTTGSPVTGEPAHCRATGRRPAAGGQVDPAAAQT